MVAGGKRFQAEEHSVPEVGVYLSCLAEGRSLLGWSRVHEEEVLGDRASRVQVGLGPGGPSRPLLGFGSCSD